MLQKILSFLTGLFRAVPLPATTYLAFDLEIAKEIPEGGDWRAKRPLGVTCAAMLTGDTGKLDIWYGKTIGGEPTSRMSREEVQAMVKALVSKVAEGGYTLLTWNGVGFDLQVLAEESGLVAECRELAMHHVDMMFYVVCVKGHYLGLGTAANGMGLTGKAPGMTGADAPRLWAEGRHQQVLDYLSQDVRTTLEVAQECQRQRALRWTSQRGNLQRIDLPSGWVTVDQALKLPEPDTSWMTAPPQRRDLVSWLAER